MLLFYVTNAKMKVHSNYSPFFYYHTLTICKVSTDPSLRRMLFCYCSTIISDMWAARRQDLSQNFYITSIKMQSPGYGIKYLLLITNTCKSIFFFNVPYAYSERLKYLFKVYVEAVLSIGYIFGHRGSLSLNLWQAPGKTLPSPFHQKDIIVIKSAGWYYNPL